MYKVVFKYQNNNVREVFKYFITEEKAKNFQKDMEKEGCTFLRMENLDEKTNYIKD